MKYRTLGKTGMKVSVVGVGTWQFGGEWGMDFSQERVDEIFEAARRQGINLIDTAECYGDHLSETFVGKAIGRDRDKWVVATKFGHKFHRAFERDTVYEPRKVVRQLEDSLKALRTDYVDLYQFHSGDDAMFDTEGLWETLAKQVEAGKVRHLGISIGSNENVYQTDKATAVGAETIEVVYNRLDRKPEEKVLGSCVRQGLGVLARVPLASGFLSGKYAVGHEFADSDVRQRWKDEGQRRAMIEQAQRIKEKEVPQGVNMAQWALAWCLKHPAVTCVIPGCKSATQVKDNAGAAKLEMVSAEHSQAAE